MIGQVPEWLDLDSLQVFIANQRETEGLVRRKAVEQLVSFIVVKRLFRHVSLHFTKLIGESQGKASSFIDEEFASVVQDSNERMLLWRPIYDNMNNDGDIVLNEPSYDGRDIQGVIDEILEQRWKCQLLDDELQPRLKQIQADPLSAIALIVPRMPGRIRKENILLEERKDSHAYILATSLVTNTAQRDIITSSDISNQIAIDTVIAKYENPNGNLRLLVLEFPKQCSLTDAMRYGRALTRLCKINEKCRQILSKL